MVEYVAKSSRKYEKCDEVEKMDKNVVHIVVQKAIYKVVEEMNENLVEKNG